ncbi:MAG: hypothetical protein ACRDD1_02915 [Planctomycetia bacterium]
MQAATADQLTDDQLQAVRELVRSNGYLPWTSKAVRLFDEAERLGLSGIAELRSKMEQGGYLPQSRAMQVIADVENARRKGG